MSDEHDTWMESIGVKVQEFMATLGADTGKTIEKKATQAPADAALTPAAQAIRKQAREDFPNHLDVFANLWLTAAVDALAGAPEAEIPDSTAGWWIALSGNLVWAATCVVAPEAKLAIAAMSFGGAFAGSGGLAGDQGKAPSGKKMISKLLTQGRDALVKSAKSTMDKAADECGRKGLTDPDEQRKLLWGKLFSTPFDEAEPIRAEMSTKIEAGLASYLQQWHQWKDETAQEATSNANQNIVNATLHLPPVPTKPFTPQLSFQ